MDRSAWISCVFGSIRFFVRCVHLHPRTIPAAFQLIVASRLAPPLPGARAGPPTLLRARPHSSILLRHAAGVAGQSRPCCTAAAEERPHCGYLPSAPAGGRTDAKYSRILNPRRGGSAAGDGHQRRRAPCLKHIIAPGASAGQVVLRYATWPVAHGYPGAGLCDLSAASGRPIAMDGLE